ncbi:MAG: nuclear transport factor 2 family protein [Actinomycetes bacterium]
MPTLPDEFDPHPARDASLRSMQAIEAGDRAAWLSLFADDAIVQDPVGVSPFDPEGHGHRGIEAIGAFYDTVVGPNDSVTFTIERSFAAGNEVANVGTITTTLPGGGGRVLTDLVINYQVNDDGKVTALRAFWELDKLRFE